MGSGGIHQLCIHHISGHKRCGKGVHEVRVWHVQYMHITAVVQ